MKKTSILVTLLLAAMLTGCGSDTESSDSFASPKTTTTTTSAETNSSAESAATSTGTAATAASEAAKQDDTAASNPDEMAKAEWEAYTQTDEYKEHMAAQAATQNDISYAGGEDFKAVSCDLISSENGVYTFKIGITSINDASAPVTYYIATPDSCMSESDASLTPEEAKAKAEWEAYADTDEYKEHMAAQAATQNAISYAGGEGFKAVSCDLISSENGVYTFKIGITSMNDATAPVWYYIATDNSCVSEADYYNN